MKRRWLAEGEGWTVNKFTLDFRVGGSEISRFRYLDGPEITMTRSFRTSFPISASYSRTEWR
jgi:uncharacterized protein YndB with AHSA1/START domain